MAKGDLTRPSFTTERKLLLLAAVGFLCEFVLGTLVALQLNLSDPGIGGSARDHWLTNSTPVTVPLVFMILYVVFLVLAFRPRWVGTLGAVGLTVLTLASGISLISDHSMVQRVVEQHLNLWTGATVALLMFVTPATVVLGILTLVGQ
jgi:hypothetical protein